MHGELFFEIPDNQTVMIQLVEAIPSSWSWVSGTLYAPDAFVHSGKAAEYTGFSIGKYHDTCTKIIGGYAAGDTSPRKPNLYAMMVEQKLPGFVIFNDTGLHGNSDTLDLAKQITIGFLHQGYRGELHFYHSYFKDNMYDNPAYCTIAFRPWCGKPFLGNEAGAQPTRIKLEWDCRYGGTEEDIAPIEAICRSLNLTEYTPTAEAHTA